MDLDITREALLAYRSQWQMWLGLKHTSDAEKQLAALKIALIDQQLAAYVHTGQPCDPGVQAHEEKFMGDPEGGNDAN